ncbi:MAG: NAD(P)/FAD-dependent oxidoreductase, partial [Actinomycetia bacterium]|nr:NAD(P)/FAD-dependent oxidoreductase [Actinomycetes bacterium]
AAFEAEGITVKAGQMANSVTYTSGDRQGRFDVTLADGSIVSGEKLLVATGRQTFLDELGVANLGLDPAQPYLTADENQRVADGLWAVGDITGDGLFTHLAIRQASIAANDILGNPTEPLNLDALSAVTFTDPEVGSVGRTEAEAIELGLEVTTVTKPVGHTARGWLHGADGVIKIVIDTNRQIVVGATSVGPAGGEVLGLLALAVHAEIPLATLRSMIYAYPT